MKRDPLGQELTERLVRLRTGDCPANEVVQLEQQIEDLKIRLTEKYDLNGIYVRPAGFYSTLGHYQGQLIGERECWKPYGQWHPMMYTVDLPRLAFVIDLTKITLWDLKRLATEFARTIRKQLRALPRQARRMPPARPNRSPMSVSGSANSTRITVHLDRMGSKNLGRLARAFKQAIRKGVKARSDIVEKRLAPLTFLRTISVGGGLFRKFLRDLRRYDLHMAHGLSFRLIAALEADERRGIRFPKDVVPRRVGAPVRGADSVEASVQRIYEAIHRKHYRARRRRLDAPAEGVDSFSCPNHGRECADLSCGYLKLWYEKVRPTLPSDKTGLVRLKGAEATGI